METSKIPFLARSLPSPFYSALGLCTSPRKLKSLREAVNAYPDSLNSFYVVYPLVFYLFLVLCLFTLPSSLLFKHFLDYNTAHSRLDSLMLDGMSFSVVYPLDVTLSLDVFLSHLSLRVPRSKILSLA